MSLSQPSWRRKIASISSRCDGLIACDRWKSHSCSKVRCELGLKIWLRTCPKLRITFTSLNCFVFPGCPVTQLYDMDVIQTLSDVGIRGEQQINERISLSNPYCSTQTGGWGLSHLGHGEDPESVGAGLLGRWATQGRRCGIKALDRADSGSLCVNYPVLVHHRGGFSGQASKRDSFLCCPRWRHLGWGGCSSREARGLGVAFALGIARANRKAVFAIGQIWHRTGQRC